MEGVSKLAWWLAISLSLLELCTACPPPETYVVGNAKDDAANPIPHDVPLGNSSMLSNGPGAPGHDRRWYSVFDLQTLEADSRLATSAAAPWPKKCGFQYVRYCFSNEHSADTLLKTVAAGIAMWKAANDLTGLLIAPDLACYTPGPPDIWEYRCICGLQADGRWTEADALVIDNGRVDINDQTTWTTDVQTTIGYNYAGANVAGTHRMQFGRLNRENPNFTPEVNQNQNEATMAHELGHAIGLQHEHQRPDRDTYLTFNCRYLEGYDAAVAKVMAPNNPDFPPDHSADDRMAKVCSNAQYAANYFPLVMEYLRGDQILDLHQNFVWPTNGRFDYGSIMIYSSLEALRWNNQDAVNAQELPLLRKLPAHPRPDSNTSPYILMGNGRPPNYVSSVSLEDIRRVAVLYPGTHEQQQRLAGLQQWEGGRVSISNLVDMYVGPTPVDVVGPDLLPA